jgi:hypothetical protein
MALLCTSAAAMSQPVTVTIPLPQLKVQRSREGAGLWPQLRLNGKGLSQMCSWYPVNPLARAARVHRRLGGSIQPKAPLDLASRRGDSSWWFDIFSSWSEKRRRIFGSTSLNGAVGHAEARTVPSIVFSNYA